MSEEEYKKEAEKDYEEYWKPLLLTYGNFDEYKIKSEMMDLIFVFKQISKVYSTITGGLLSKPMYYADTIIEQYEDQISAAYDEGYKEGSEDSK